MKIKIIIICSLFLLPVFALANTYSAELNGSTQYFSITDGNISANFPGKNGTEITKAIYQFAVKYTALPTNDYDIFWIFNKKESSNGYLIDVQKFPSGGFQINYRFEGGTAEFTITTPTINTWYYYTFVYDGSVPRVYLYINEAPIGNLACEASLSGNTDTFKTGQRNAGGYFYGQLDEIRFWTKALTENEIIANYNCELAGNESGLEAYWQFENNSDDTTANNNDLTNNNSITYTNDEYPTIGACGGGEPPPATSTPTATTTLSNTEIFTTAFIWFFIFFGFTIIVFRYKFKE